MRMKFFGFPAAAIRGLLRAQQQTWFIGIRVYSASITGGGPLLRLVQDLSFSSAGYLRWGSADIFLLLNFTFTRTGSTPGVKPFTEY
jgi:hypothetical protein